MWKTVNHLVDIYYCCCCWCFCHTKDSSNGCRLLQEEQETDVSVCVSSGFRLRAHKAVLLARAPHLLQGTAPNASIINLQGTEPTALKELIRCVLYVCTLPCAAFIGSVCLIWFIQRSSVITLPYDEAAAVTLQYTDMHKNWYKCGRSSWNLYLWFYWGFSFCPALCARYYCLYSQQIWFFGSSVPAHQFLWVNLSN